MCSKKADCADTGLRFFGEKENKNYIENRNKQAGILCKQSGKEEDS